MTLPNFEHSCGSAPLTHRLIAQRVMTRRTDQGQRSRYLRIFLGTGIDGLDDTPNGQRCGLKRMCVVVEITGIGQLRMLFVCHKSRTLNKIVVVWTVGEEDRISRRRMTRERYEPPCGWWRGMTCESRLRHPRILPLQERPFHFPQTFQQSRQSRRGFDILLFCCIAVVCIVDICWLFGRRMEETPSIGAEEYRSHFSIDSYCFSVLL